MNSIYKTSSNRGLVSRIECLPSPKIAVSQKVDRRIGEGFNQEDGFDTVSFFLSIFFYIKTEVSMWYLECFWVNFVAILINITRVKYVPLTNWTQQNIFRFHILIDLRVILTVKWNFPFSTTCILTNLILDSPQLLFNLQFAEGNS